MKVSPILICRTKYVDYNDPVFCAPADISNSITKSLHDIIIKGNNLIFTNECKVFISDDQHIVIGKVLYIRELGEYFDTSLDKEKDGRKAWGFIGGVLSRTEYVAKNQILDLPKEYYVRAYKECLYDSHWDKKDFNGPYTSEVVDVNMEVLSDLTSSSLNTINDIPIFPSSMNDKLFRYVAKQTIKGSKVAFCSNEEFNASEAITKGALTYATVSERNLRDQIESYKKALAAKRENPNEDTNDSKSRKYTDYYKDNSERNFYKELSRLCDNYRYKLHPFKNNNVYGVYIIIGETDKSNKDNSLKAKIRRKLKM